jgi:hypothetical protein
MNFVCSHRYTRHVRTSPFILTVKSPSFYYFDNIARWRKPQRIECHWNHRSTTQLSEYGII